MKRKPLPIPQHEFGFTPDTFNLHADRAPVPTGQEVATAESIALALKRAAAEQATPTFDEADCGGVFDGFTVTSDADPGL